MVQRRLHVLRINFKSFAFDRNNESKTGDRRQQRRVTTHAAKVSTYGHQVRDATLRFGIGRRTAGDQVAVVVTENVLRMAWSNKKEGLWTSKGARTRAPSAFSTGEEACSSSISQASRAGAPANGSTRARASTNGSSEESLTLERLCSRLDFPLDWLRAGVLHRTSKHYHPLSSRSAS